MNRGNQVVQTNAVDTDEGTGVECELNVYDP